MFYHSTPTVFLSKKTHQLVAIELPWPTMTIKSIKYFNLDDWLVFKIILMFTVIKLHINAKMHFKGTGGIV